MSIALVAALLAALAACMPLPRHTETGLIEFDIAAFGDSYTAGNAATAGGGDDGYYFKSPDDPRAEADIRQRPSPISPATKDCFRNHNNYSETLYQMLGSSGAYINGACSGDTTAELLNGVGSSGQLNGFTEAQRNEVDLITLSIGGNDLRFSEVVRDCFSPVWTEVTCNARLLAAEVKLLDGSLYRDMKNALQYVSVSFPSARIVLVGYPLFIDAPENEEQDETSPVGRIVRGLNGLNIDQQRLVNELNPVGAPARFEFLPLHGSFFDEHGIGGDEEQWIQNLWGTPYVEEWAHPTAAGHAAIAAALRDLQLVKDAFNAKRQAASETSMTKIGSQWYILDAHDKLWKAHHAYVQCMMSKGFKTRAWSQEALFAAATNAPPYPQLPVEDGVDVPVYTACSRPGAENDGAILFDATSDVDVNGYWRMTSSGYGTYARTRTSANVAQCNSQRGGISGDIVNPNFFYFTPDTGGWYTDDTCWLTQQAVFDPSGTLWMVETWPSRPPTATIVAGDWMVNCVVNDESHFPGDIPTVTLDSLGVVNPNTNEQYQDTRCLHWE